MDPRTQDILERCRRLAGDEWPRGSVLEGQHRRTFLESWETMGEAILVVAVLEAHGIEVDNWLDEDGTSGSSFTPPVVSHLPDGPDDRACTSWPPAPRACAISSRSRCARAPPAAGASRRRGGGPPWSRRPSSSRPWAARRRARARPRTWGTYREAVPRPCGCLRHLVEVDPSTADPEAGIIGHAERDSTPLANASCQVCDGSGVEMRPGILHAFKPTAVEYVVTGRETDADLERLERRGITPVRIERVGDLPFQEGQDDGADT